MKVFIGFGSTIRVEMAGRVEHMLSIRQGKSAHVNDKRNGLVGLYFLQKSYCGAHAVVSYSSSTTKGEGELVLSNTLDDGFQRSDWLCLEDGCFELVFGGGSAESEMSFEFLDEVRRGCYGRRARVM